MIKIEANHYRTGELYFVCPLCNNNHIANGYGFKEDFCISNPNNNCTLIMSRKDIKKDVCNCGHYEKHHAHGVCTKCACFAFKKLNCEVVK